MSDKEMEKRMKMIRNRMIPVKGFSCINLFGVLFVRHGVSVTEEMLNHEAVHTAQMKEMLYVFFYLWYVAEWLVRLAVCGKGKKAYRNLSFEKEAYAFQKCGNYRGIRKNFAWIKYL